MMMDAMVNVNGRLAHGASATIPVFDHGFLFGEGVYETLRTYNRRPFLLNRHLWRLRTSADLIELPVPLTDTVFAARIDETMAAVSAPGEQYIRLLMTRGVGELSYDPKVCLTPSVVIIVRPHIEISAEIQARGIKIIVSSVMRNHPEAIDPRIKSNNLLNNALAVQEALRRQADEALMRNYRGEIAECAQSNFFLVRGDDVLTPPLDAGLLEGVTRNFVLEIGVDVNVQVRECVLLDRDLETADEMFITSTHTRGASGHRNRRSPRRLWRARSHHTETRRRLPTESPPTHSRLGSVSSYASTGGHAHTRCRSPYAASIALTGGQYLLARTKGRGNTAASREYG